MSKEPRYLWHLVCHRNSKHSSVSEMSKGKVSCVPEMSKSVHIDWRSRSIKEAKGDQGVLVTAKLCAVDMCSLSV